jgi:hypothetical protein
LSYTIQFQYQAGEDSFYWSSYDLASVLIRVFEAVTEGTQPEIDFSSGPLMINAGGCIIILPSRALGRGMLVLHQPIVGEQKNLSLGLFCDNHVVVCTSSRRAYIDATAEHLPPYRLSSPRTE